MPCLQTSLSPRLSKRTCCFVNRACITVPTITKNYARGRATHNYCSLHSSFVRTCFYPCSNDKERLVRSIRNPVLLKWLDSLEPEGRLVVAVQSPSIFHCTELFNTEQQGSLRKSHALFSGPPHMYANTPASTDKGHSLKAKGFAPACKSRQTPDILSK